MGKEILIHPVTRIEGHAKITIQLDDSGQVSDAIFHVNEFRGFEKFCEGRYYTEMPVITPRICGICPVSHTISSVKACEMIQQIKIPRTAELLRRVIQQAQLISSHALSFFHLSAPDLLLGWDSDPATRNIFGIAEKDPDLGVRGIRLRKFGQEVSERITGKKIHIMGIVPGGMSYALTKENRQAILDWIPEVLETTHMSIDLLKKYHADHTDMVNSFANIESMHMGLIADDGSHELYDGRIRLVAANGDIVADRLNPLDYHQFIQEKPVSWSYLKSFFYKPMGYPDGIYRVGPLSRLNVIDRMKTPQAQKEFEEFRALGQGRPVHGNFYYHYARFIEILAGIEEIEQMMKDPDILSTDIQTHASRNQPEGIGCCEAPRGILFHHYKTDPDGKLNQIDFLIATGQNNPSMNQAILDVARQYVKGDHIEEGALNRVEGAIRCFDPCLSCSTHALGDMPIRIELKNSQGEVIQRIARG